MKTLCIDARQLGQATGIAVYLRHLLPHLKQGPFRIHLLAPQALRDDPLLKGCEHQPIDAGIFSMKEQLELPRAIPRCDLYWTPHFYMPLFPIRAKKRVVTLHDVFYLSPFARPPHSSPIKGRIYPRIAYLLLRYAASVSERVITVSSFSAREIEEKLKIERRRIQMIPNGADHLMHLAPETLPFSLPSPYLLFVRGANVPYKNLRGALQTLEILHRQGLKISLVITGREMGGINVEKAKEIPLHLEPYVIRVGAVTEGQLISLYRDATALLFPSFFEGFGLPPVEAMSLSCPVITSHVASLPEVVGDAALIVDPSSSASMADAVNRLLQQPLLREELIAKGKRRAMAFSWKRAAERHLETFMQIMSS